MAQVYVCRGGIDSKLYAERFPTLQTLLDALPHLFLMDDFFHASHDFAHLGFNIRE